MLKRLSMASAGVLGGPSEPAEGTATPTDTSSRATQPRQSTAGPSLAGFMLSRKFAKRLSTKVTGRRDMGSAVGLLQREPTYRMEPKKPFDRSSVEKIIKEILEDRLENFRYSPKFSSTMIKVITEEIKERVKLLDFDRYKIICVITLAQKNDQGLMISSRCNWDKKTDNYASYTYSNPNIICSASVYGVYRE